MPKFTKEEINKCQYHDYLCIRRKAFNLPLPEKHITPVVFEEWAQVPNNSVYKWCLEQEKEDTFESLGVDLIKKELGLSGNGAYRNIKRERPRNFSRGFAGRGHGGFANFGAHQQLSYGNGYQGHPYHGFGQQMPMGKIAYAQSDFGSIGNNRDDGHAAEYDTEGFDPTPNVKKRKIGDNGMTMERVVEETLRQFQATSGHITAGTASLNVAATAESSAKQGDSDSNTATATKMVSKQKLMVGSQARM